MHSFCYTKGNKGKTTSLVSSIQILVMWFSLVWMATVHEKKETAGETCMHLSHMGCSSSAPSLSLCTYLLCMCPHNGNGENVCIPITLCYTGKEELLNFTFLLIAKATFSPIVTTICICSLEKEKETGNKTGE